MIRLAQSTDGRLVLASNQPFPADVARVEYYREQRLFMLVYDNEDKDSDLMPCEIGEKEADIVKSSPDIMVIAMSKQGEEPLGYNVPLVQIGL